MLKHSTILAGLSYYQSLYNKVFKPYPSTDTTWLPEQHSVSQPNYVHDNQEEIYCSSKRDSHEATAEQERCYSNSSLSNTCPLNKGPNKKPATRAKDNCFEYDSNGKIHRQWSDLCTNKESFSGGHVTFSDNNNHYQSRSRNIQLTDDDTISTDGKWAEERSLGRNTSNGYTNLWKHSTGNSFFKINVPHIESPPGLIMEHTLTRCMPSEKTVFKPKTMLPHYRTKGFERDGELHILGGLLHSTCGEKASTSKPKYGREHTLDDVNLMNSIGVRNELTPDRSGDNKSVDVIDNGTESPPLDFENDAILSQIPKLFTYGNEYDTTLANGEYEDGFEISNTGRDNSAVTTTGKLENNLTLTTDKSEYRVGIYPNKYTFDDQNRSSMIDTDDSSAIQKNIFHWSDNSSEITDNERYIQNDVTSYGDKQTSDARLLAEKKHLPSSSEEFGAVSIVSTAVKSSPAANITQANRTASTTVVRANKTVALSASLPTNKNVTKRSTLASRLKEIRDR